jgi:hypothetical protein
MANALLPGTSKQVYVVTFETGLKVLKQYQITVDCHAADHWKAQALKQLKQ